MVTPRNKGFINYVKDKSKSKFLLKLRRTVFLSCKEQGAFVVLGLVEDLKPLRTTNFSFEMPTRFIKTWSFLSIAVVTPIHLIHAVI